LRHAAGFIVPVIKSAPEAVEALRRLADNRFINASKPGVFKFETVAPKQTESRRKIEL